MSGIFEEKSGGGAGPIAPTLGLLPVIALSAALTGQAHAQAQNGSDVVLEEINVEAKAGTQASESYKADRLSSSKYTQPLLDTPRTVTVVTQKQMEERGQNSVTEVLRTTPGISLGSGEGGTPMGDRPFIRGFEASTDMMVDGVRNLGRSSYESFALESIEVSKGPGGVYNGRGSTGGSINMVSKTPQMENFVNVSGTLGTDATKRTTFDGNHYFDNGVGVRLNALWHDADVAGRDEVFQKRWGIAPSISFGMDGPTKATLSYYYLKTDELPDFGLPFPNSVQAGRPATSDNPYYPVDVDRNNFYGSVFRDFRKTETHLATAKLEHEFNDRLRIENVLRYAFGKNDYIFTRPSMNEATTGSNATPATPFGEVERASRANRRESMGVANQTNLVAEFEAGGLEHSFVAGVEFAYERLRNGGYQGIPDIGRTSLYNPDPFTPVDMSNLAETAYGDPYKTETQAAYLFDTIKFNEQWSLNAGIRLDNYHVTDVGNDRSNKATMFNYQVGLVYKPLPYASLYVAHGTSSNPAGETLGQSGGADGVAGGGLSAAQANLDPEKNVSYEIGTKWDVLDERLSLTAALFYTEKTNQRANDPTTGQAALIGNSRAKGIELGVAGNITDRWQVFGGYTYTDAKLVDDAKLVNSNDGNRLKFIPAHTFSVWSTYDVTEKLTMGGGAYYMSERFMDDANTKALPSHWRVDLMAAYKVNENFDLQLNINNLFNETIYDASHVGIFGILAPGRSAHLKATARF
ncbi:TonB-dependent receptor [Aquamicrobium segne]|uniref:TonB-dependent receptor n=1 Tax=Aquamicrobium segne TaxID=469547 RepID=A0ABW0H4M3_9HYPH